MKCIAFLPAVLLGMSLLPPAQAADSTERTWHLAYQKVLTAYSRMQGFEVSSEDEHGARWDLCDVDGDGIPELFISPDDSHVNGVMIYTCQAGEPVLLQSGSQQAFGENGLTAVNTDEHIVGSFRTGSGIVQRTFYKMENGKLTQLDSFMNDLESYPDDEKSKAVWELNSHTVQKKDYDAAYEPYSSIVWREDVGRAYAFIDRSPLAAIQHSPTANEPPDMKFALIWGSVAALIAAVGAAAVSLLWRAE
jgi:hypothetical protein